MKAPLIASLLLLSFCHSLTCSAMSETPTLDRIKKTKSISIGVREHAPPFAMYEEGGGKGYSVDICNAIVAGLEKQLAMKLDVNYVSVSAKDRIGLVKSGQIDMECGSTTTTRDREKEVNFTYPIFVTGARIAVRKGSSITDYRNMPGARVAVVSGSSAEKLMQSVLQSATTRGQGFTLSTVKDNDAGVTSLAAGQIDVFSTDDILLAGAISSSKLDDKLVRTGSFISIEPYAIMTNKQDVQFLKLVDLLLADQLTSGKAQKLIVKWFDTSTFHYKINHLTASVFNFPAKSQAVP